MQLKNYQSVLSTLQEHDEVEELPNPSAQIANDPYEQEFVAEEEENGNEEVNLVLRLETVYYLMQDVEELQKEWQETHQQEIFELRQCMQAQLTAQSAKSKGQGNLGGTVWYPAAGMMLTRQPGLLTSAPVFVPGQGPTGIGATFYNSTPRIGDHTQAMGSVSRSTDQADPVNVYSSFQKPEPMVRVSYGDHRIADPMTRSGPEQCMNLSEQEVTEEGMILAAKSLCKVQIEKFDSKKLNRDRWRKQFELQMNVNSVSQDYWV